MNCKYLKNGKVKFEKNVIIPLYYSVCIVYQVMMDKYIGQTKASYNYTYISLRDFKDQVKFYRYLSSLN